MWVRPASIQETEHPERYLVPEPRLDIIGHYKGFHRPADLLESLLFSADRKLFKDAAAKRLIVRGFNILHGSGKHIKNMLSGIKKSVSDPRALAKGFFPLPHRSHSAEPEGVNAALERPDRVNPAALIIEPAGPVRFLGDAETR
jgi:hypothetical protein